MFFCCCCTKFKYFVASGYKIEMDDGLQGLQSSHRHLETNYINRSIDDLKSFLNKNKRKKG